MSTLYTEGMKIEQLTAYLSERLELDKFVALDSSLNGLQVGRPGKEVKRLAVAVDASLETFKRAAELECDALFAHHGLFWGKPLAITELHYERIATLLNNDIALIAAHLPLDVHAELGNNATMARLLELEEVEPFGYYHGIPIGFQGRFNQPKSPREIAQTLGLSSTTGLHIMEFGPPKISTLGIVSGGAPNSLMEAIDLDLDAFLTGETSHTMYSYCKEAGKTMISGGHYATEVFGVKEVAKELSAKFSLETTFIEFPTAL